MKIDHNIHLAIMTKVRVMLDIGHQDTNTLTGADPAFLKRGCVF
jgi:hypothetical protein